MKCTKQEFETIVKICERAEQLDISAGERITLIMDLENAHNTVGLKLKDLLMADNMDFAHDIIGIQRYMNRSTGQLEDFFVPRYAVQKEVDINAVIESAKEKAALSDVDSVATKTDIENSIE